MCEGDSLWALASEKYGTCGQWREIAAANGLAPGDPALEGVIASRKPGVLSRVINLETGSLAVEAALKMMLARFYT